MSHFAVRENLNFLETASRASLIYQRMSVFRDPRLWIDRCGSPTSANYCAGAGSAGGAGASSTAAAGAAGAAGAASAAAGATTPQAPVAQPDDEPQLLHDDSTTPQPPPHDEPQLLPHEGAASQQDGAAAQQVGAGLQCFTFTVLHFTGLHFTGLQHLWPASAVFANSIAANVKIRPNIFIVNPLRTQILVNRLPECSHSGSENASRPRELLETAAHPILPDRNLSNNLPIFSSTAHTPGLPDVRPTRSSGIRCTSPVEFTQAMTELASVNSSSPRKIR